MAINDGAEEIREVDQQLAEEDQIKNLKKTVPFYIGLAVVTVLIVGSKQFLDARTRSIANESAEAYTAANLVLEEDEEGAIRGFDSLVSNGPKGYSALASLRLSSIMSEKGNREEAYNYLMQVANNAELENRLRNVARIKAAYLALDDSREKVMQTLNGLESGQLAFTPHALEVAGLAALQDKDYAAATAYFDVAEANPRVTPQVSARVKEWSALASLGSKGKELKVSEGTSAQGLLNLLDAVDQSQNSETSNEIETQQGGTNEQ